MTIEVGLLGPGERCMWSGRPHPGWFALRRLGSHDFFSFACFAGAVFLFMGLAAHLAMPAVARAQADPRSDPFFIGLLLLSGAAVVWFWLRGTRTKYLLTNRRLVIDTVGPFAKRISVPLEHVRLIVLRSRVLSPSDLIFRETGQRGFPTWGFKDNGFIAIADATRVERLLREAIDQTFSTRSRGPSQ